jgi:hypothetical protein
MHFHRPRNEVTLRYEIAKFQFPVLNSSTAALSKLTGPEYRRTSIYMHCYKAYSASSGGCALRWKRHMLQPTSRADP